MSSSSPVRRWLSARFVTALVAGALCVVLAAFAGWGPTIPLVLLVGALNVGTALSAQRFPRIELHLSCWFLTALVIAFGVLALISYPEKYSFGSCLDYSGRYDYLLEGATVSLPAADVDGVGEQQAPREPPPVPTSAPTPQRAEVDEPEERLPDCAVEFPRVSDNARNRANHSRGSAMLGLSSLVAALTLATRSLRIREPAAAALPGVGFVLLLLNCLFLLGAAAWLYPEFAAH